MRCCRSKHASLKQKLAIFDSLFRFQLGERGDPVLLRDLAQPPGHRGRAVQLLPALLLLLRRGDGPHLEALLDYQRVSEQVHFLLL